MKSEMINLGLLFWQDICNLFSIEIFRYNLCRTLH